MKKIAVLLMFIGVGSVLSAQTRMVRLTRFEDQKITGVSASSTFDVQLIRSDKTYAVVEINEEYESALRFEIDPQGVVHVGIQSGRGGFKNLKNRAYIYLSDLSGIHASGSSDVECSGRFESVDTRIELSGSSDLSGLELAASGEVHIQASGASDFKNSSIQCRELIGTFSGSSDVELNNFSGNLTCDLSGSSDMKINGSAGVVSVKCTGASDFKGGELAAQVGRVEAASASQISLGRIEKEFSSKGSGASSITYRGDPALNSVTNSSASSIRKL